MGWLEKSAGDALRSWGCRSGAERGSLYLFQLAELSAFQVMVLEAKCSFSHLNSLAVGHVGSQK